MIIKTANCNQGVSISETVCPKTSQNLAPDEVIQGIFSLKYLVLSK